MLEFFFSRKIRGINKETGSMIPRASESFSLLPYLTFREPCSMTGLGSQPGSIPAAREP